MSKKNVLIGIILLSVVVISVAQDLSTLLGQPLPQDPNLVTGVLENGLRYVIKKNNQPANRAELRLIVDVGAIDEDEDQLGLAHFTEHMVFKGTKNFTKQEMINYLNSIGMGFGGGLNAFTSQENTAYSLSAPTDNDEQLEKAFQILAEMGNYAIFDEEELEEERGVIIEEWRMYQGASQRIRDKIQKVMLAGSRYAERTPIGTLEVLENFESPTIKRFYKDWYRPDLQTVLVIGDVEPEKIESLITQTFGTEQTIKNPRPREEYEVPDHEEPHAIVAIDSEMSYTSIQLIWKHEPTEFKTIEDFLEDMIILLGTSMLNARLEEYTRSADAPFSYAGSYHTNITNTKSGFMINAYTDEDKVKDAAKALLTETERIKQYGFTPGELQRSISRVKTNLERSVADMENELSSRLTWNYLRRIMNGSVLLSEEQRLQLFTSLQNVISLEQVNQMIASFITDENFVLTVMGPEKEDLEYPSEEELLALRKHVQEISIEEYQDTVVDEPFMTEIPEPGSIEKEDHLEKAGITRLELSNGAVVFLKKTDFKNDEVVFQAISPGGYSLYPPEDVATARNAASIVMESGFGNFDKNTLDKALSGKIVRLEATIEREKEGFSGSFAPKNTEDFFQLLYQYVTNPRKSENSFRSYIQKQITFTKNKKLNPEAVFWDSVNVILKDNNPYFVSDTVQDLQNINQDRAMEIYEDRFSDFSDFTFFFVGNFDEELLKSYSKTYLSNLPGTNRKENYRVVYEPVKSGIHTETVSVGKDEKSIVYALNRGENTYSPEYKTKLNALQLLTNEKLRLNIREALSGVYYVGMQAKLQAKPFEEYSLYTVLFCSPERHQELFDATYTTMDSLKAGFITEDDVDFVKSTLLRNLETQEIRNQYYLEQMVENIWNDIPIEDFLHRKERIESMNKESLLNTAKKFMTHDENLFRIIKLPKE